MLGSERSHVESLMLGQLKSKLALSILRDFHELFCANACFGRDWVREGVLVLHSADKPACHISSPCHFPNSIPRAYLSMTTNKMEVWHAPLTKIWICTWLHYNNPINKYCGLSIKMLLFYILSSMPSGCLWLKHCLFSKLLGSADSVGGFTIFFCIAWLSYRPF